MKVLLVSLNAKYVHTNIAVRYLKSYLKKGGVNADFCEYTINEPLGGTLRKLYMSGADVYGFSCYIWNIDKVLYLAENLKIMKPDCKIFLGGPEVSFDGEEIIKKYDFIDAVVLGEGEKATLKLLKDMDFNKRVVFTDSLISLDELEFPYDDNDLKEVLKGEKLLYFETTRGCPFSCAYCLSSITDGVRYLSLDRVKEDIKKMTDAGAITIKFVDRTFNADRKRALEIWKYCVSLEGKTKFHFEIGADLLDKECIEFLKTVPESKFLFEIGVQSTNLKTLNSVSRKSNLEKLKENVIELREKGNIHLHLDLIAGLPFEDFESFKKSFNDVFYLNPHALQLGFLKFLKGSALRKGAEEFGAVYASCAPYEIYSNDALSIEDVIKLHRVEDVLERYYNSERFSNSIYYAVERFSSPFDFFEKLSAFFEEKGLIGQGVKRITLYNLLFSFMEKNTNDEELEVFRNLLRRDFEEWHSKGVGTPSWYRE